ncbi:MAG: Wzz/FepE/Etk N-terminal domain-containing protein, partial [Bacteroidota bacterium]
MMSEEKSNDIINLKFYFELLKKHILIIGFCAIVGLLCAYVLYFFTEKKYSASSSLLIEKTSDGLGLDDLFSSSLYGRNS